MKRDGKYRFTLQFPADTERRIQAGELLEQLGNRKSAVVVAALCEYAEKHPELLPGPCGRRFRPSTQRPALPLRSSSASSLANSWR